MTGWTRRRTSGEVINATLLEVFLALAFMVFALAVFEKRRADENEGKLFGALTQRAARALRDSLEAAKESLLTTQRSVSVNAESLLTAHRAIAQLRFDSPYPSDCDPQARPEDVLTVGLVSPGRLEISVNRSAFGLTAGERFWLSPTQFSARFAAVREESRDRGCRYKVRIEDSPSMSKEGYKEAMAAVTNIFRFRNAFR